MNDVSLANMVTFGELIVRYELCNLCDTHLSSFFTLFICSKWRTIPGWSMLSSFAISSSCFGCFNFNVCFQLIIVSNRKMFMTPFSIKKKFEISWMKFFKPTLSSAYVDASVASLRTSLKFYVICTAIEFQQVKINLTKILF